MLLTDELIEARDISASGSIFPSKLMGSSPGRLKLRVIDSVAAWQEVNESWDDLVANCVYPNVFSTFAWQYQWWQAFGEGRRLRIVCVEDGSQLVGLLPLYAEGRDDERVCKKLRSIGHGAAVTPDYLGFIVRQGYVKAASEVLAAHLAQPCTVWSSLVLEEFAAEDAGTNCLVQLLMARFPSVVRRGESRWFIELPETYEAYLQTLSSHNRQKKRNRLRQAERKHDSKLLEISHPDLHKWFPQIVELTAKARARHGEPSSFRNASYAGFHRELLSRLMPSGNARLLVLQYGAEIVAYWYLLCLGKKVYAYQSAADPNQPGSPGDVALQMVLMRMIEQGFTELDFLCGDHSYKRGYTSKSHPTNTAYIFRSASASYFSRLVVERLLRPAKRGLRDFFSIRTSSQAACKR